jgi:hypothetical protein
MAEPAHAPIEVIEPDTPVIARDATNGRFLAGNSGNGGRKTGSRNLLTSRFLDDLAASWEREGASALARCAAEDPTGYCRMVSGLLPREALLAVSVDATLKVAQNAAEAFALLARLPKQELLELKKNADPVDG